MKKAQNNLVIVGVVVLVIVFLSGFMLVKGRSGSEATPTPTPEEILPEADPNIKVDAKANKDGTGVVLSVSEIPKDITAVEYELTYKNDKGLPKGVLGNIKLDKPGMTVSREITLGTCSSGKCVYDKNVAKVTVTLKFASDKGASKFQKEFNL